MVDCMECTNFIECHYSGQLTGRLTSCPDFKQKPKTNADRIRAMDDELLATQLTQVFHEGVTALTKMEMPDNLLNEVRAQILKKLKQPAKGDA